ncbi:inositol-3-phosphate synthase [Embleya scabrispora]|uniref:inositol-3-phosphate synthase n=1 Tax=Embleya scabrispora TaxID=159449 RepID=UPI000370E7B9|nr:inositol-3-phosphate synthase [Embleya scabrispora]
MARRCAALAAGENVLPPSARYAWAAAQAGCAFVDFTPSAGARIPGVAEVFTSYGVPFAGSDGKTGETLLKTVLAPMFAQRALRVTSWSGTNLLGGGDGETLSRPERAAAKIDSKDRALRSLLGHPVGGGVHIHNVPELGEWKTAWDHVTFEGFLGTRMNLQFTWTGCDSALAAPLVLDLARLSARALDAGCAGPLRELAFYFKDPVGTDVHALSAQYDALVSWAQERLTARQEVVGEE